MKFAIEHKGYRFRFSIKTFESARPAWQGEWNDAKAKITESTPTGTHTDRDIHLEGEKVEQALQLLKEAVIEEIAKRIDSNAKFREEMIACGEFKDDEIVYKIEDEKDGNQ